jgi:hypothetical protein
MTSTNNIDSKEKANHALLGVTGVSEQADEVCASCGIAEVDNVKLKKCTCDIVKCCIDECRDEHQEQHDEECKKRMAELRDKTLFTQPDSCSYGECPICFLPLSLDRGKCLFYSCCSKSICDGCEYANYMSNGGDNCPFCREPNVNGDELNRMRVMKRVEANDPVAVCKMGTILNKQGDYGAAIEYWKKAAELGDADAHFELGVMHKYGYGVEKDEEKAVYYSLLL